MTTAGTPATAATNIHRTTSLENTRRRAFGTSRTAWHATEARKGTRMVTASAGDANATDVRRNRNDDPKLTDRLFGIAQTRRSRGQMLTMGFIP